MEFKAREIADILGGTVDGNPDATVSTFARIEQGKPGAICFFANPKYEQYVYECKADIIIVNRSFEPKQAVAATMVRVDDAYSAVATLLDYVTAKKRSYKRYRGCRCRVRWSAKLGKKVYVGDFAYIGKNAEVGDYTKIYENVSVGDGVKIDNLCQIAHNVEVGKNSVMASMTGIAGSAKIGEHCILAGQVGVAGHITIADNTTIGAQSGIMSSIKEPGQTLMGSPAFPLKDYLRSYAVFKRGGKK